MLDSGCGSQHPRKTTVAGNYQAEACLKQPVMDQGIWFRQEDSEHIGHSCGKQSLNSQMMLSSQVPNLCPRTFGWTAIAQT